MNPTKKHRLWLFVFIFVAIILRIGLFALLIEKPARSAEPDTESYIKSATVLVETGNYTPTDTVRTPLYPMFIALMSFPFVNITLSVVLGQIFLNGLTIFTVFQLGLKLNFSKREALLAAILLSFSLESFLTTFLVLTETLYTFLITLSLYYLVDYCLDKRKLSLAISALLIGLSILCRPAGLFYPLVITTFLLIWGEHRFYQRLLSGFTFIVLVALPLAPWVIRNSYVLGVPTISTIQNYNLLFYNAASLEADKQGLPIVQVQEELKQRAETELVQAGLPYTEANADRVYGAMGREIILSDLPRYVYVHLKYDLRNFLPGLGSAVSYIGISTGSTEGLDVFRTGGTNAVMNNYFGQETWMLALLIPFVILLGITYLGSISGLAHLFMKRQWFTLLVMAGTIGYFMLLPGAPSNSRFRVPAMPFIALTAGQGLFVIATKSKSLLSGKK
jgi:4-amino-4-deoxy-L-arabinose transferase-like glycosyltransferase